MHAYQRAVPVLQVADVERSCRWYREVLDFTADPFPREPPHSFAILRREGAEIMLQFADSARGSPPRPPDPEFRWTVYLRVVGTTILDVAGAVERKTRVLRGPERMFYGLVELEICDPDGYRVCVSGEAPPGAQVKVRQENE